MHAYYLFDNVYTYIYVDFINPFSSLPGMSIFMIDWLVEKHNVSHHKKYIKNMQHCPQHKD